MRALACVGLAALLFAPGRALAVSEDADEPAVVVSAKVEREERGVSREEALRQEELRRAEAEKRVEKIRALAPEQVQEWIDGKISEAELDRAAARPPAPAPVTTLAVPRARLNRLLLVSAAALVLAVLLALQRRRARREAT